VEKNQQIKQITQELLDQLNSGKGEGAQGGDLDMEQ